MMKKSTLAMFFAAACMLTTACSDCKSGSCSGENGDENYEAAVINPNAEQDYTAGNLRFDVDDPIAIQ